jgi:hypothetical protein
MRKAAQMDMKNTWHYDGNFVTGIETEQIYPKHLIMIVKANFPIDYVPSLRTVFSLYVLFLSILQGHQGNSYSTHSKLSNKQHDELSLVRRLANVDISYFAVCFC